MRTKQKSDKKTRVRNVPKKETEISKLETELKEVQVASATIVKPEVSVIADPELYFSFMEIAALNLYATRRSTEALKIMTQLFTQYQEFKNASASEYDISGMFDDSHNKKDKEDK